MTTNAQKVRSASTAIRHERCKFCPYLCSHASGKVRLHPLQVRYSRVRRVRTGCRDCSASLGVQKTSKYVLKQWRQTESTDYKKMLRPRRVKSHSGVKVFCFVYPEVVLNELRMKYLSADTVPRDANEPLIRSSCVDTESHIGSSHPKPVSPGDPGSPRGLAGVGEVGADYFSQMPGPGDCPPPMPLATPRR